MATLGDDEAERMNNASQLLMRTLSNWYPQQTPYKKKFRRLTLRKQAQEDERSLCHSDWSADASLDQPSYGSVVLQIKEANSEADGSFDFVRKTCDILQNTLVVTVLLGVFMALPVTMVTMGVKYLEECPKEPKIPIYLLVGGCFGLLRVMSMLWKQVRSRRYERLDDIYDGDDGNGDMIMSKSSRFSEAILSLFLFIWFILGNYWVLTIWKPNFHQLLHEPSNWCDQTVYLFAFGQIVGCYGLMGLIFILTCILVTCHRCSMAFDKS